jgi:hypothetical protein
VQLKYTRRCKYARDLDVASAPFAEDVVVLNELDSITESLERNSHIKRWQIEKDRSQAEA